MSTRFAQDWYQAGLQNRHQTICEGASQMVVVPIHDLTFLDCPANFSLAELFGQIDEMNVLEILGSSSFGLENGRAQNNRPGHLAGSSGIPGMADGSGQACGDVKRRKRVVTHPYHPEPGFRQGL